MPEEPKKDEKIPDAIPPTTDPNADTIPPEGEVVEQVEEVIEEHIPAVPAPVRGLDEVYQRLDQLDATIKAELGKLTQFKPAEPKEPKAEPKPNQPKDLEQPHATTPKVSPSRKVKLFRKRG